MLSTLSFDALTLAVSRTSSWPYVVDHRGTAFSTPWLQSIGPSLSFVCVALSSLYGKVSVHACSGRRSVGDRTDFDQGQGSARCVPRLRTQGFSLWDGLVGLAGLASLAGLSGQRAAGGLDLAEEVAGISFKRRHKQTEYPSRVLLFCQSR